MEQRATMLAGNADEFLSLDKTFQYAFEDSSKNVLKSSFNGRRA